MKATEYWYLGSPYGKYPGGPEQAYYEITKQAALLIRNGVVVFAPITMTHPIHNVGAFPNSFQWLDHDDPFIDKAKGLICCMMEGWQESVGLEYELMRFKLLKKPILYMTPDVIPGALLLNVEPYNIKVSN